LSVVEEPSTRYSVAVSLEHENLNSTKMRELRENLIVYLIQGSSQKSLIPVLTLKKVRKQTLSKYFNIKKKDILLIPRVFFLPNY